VRDESGVVSGRGVAVVEDIDRGDDRGQSSGPVRRVLDGVGQFDADPVLGDGDGGDRQFVVVEEGAVERAAFVGDEDVGIQDQASARGSIRSFVT
jgi:hypothetical protein